MFNNLYIYIHLHFLLVSQKLNSFTIFTRIFNEKNKEII
jgi:hypothetical protein